MTGIGVQELSDGQVQEIIELIFKFTGMTLSESKKSLMQGRIRPRMRLLGIDSFTAYINYLAVNTEEKQEFINQITTHETSFFRTPRLWEYFRETYLPEWVKVNPNRKLSIWSGAASTGEEIYTIAMVCKDFARSNVNFDFTIYGTDISTQVLRIAEKGFYTGKTIEGLNKNDPDTFKKNFVPVSDGYEVIPGFKSKIQFDSHNLLQPMQRKFDLVFLRNVLIYFEKREQELILLHISNTLPFGGKLFLGESESLTGLTTKFKFVVPLIYEKKLEI